MDAFTTLDATAIAFYKDDIDTDQIIPARFLTGTTKTGLGQKLFYDWRYDANGQIMTTSPFDQPQNKGAQVLVGGHNFGCGSSREHAPWSLKDFGFRAVIAVSFADIFYNNALKNAVLPVALPESVVKPLADAVLADPTIRIAIDLASQTVTLPGSGTHSFEINAYRKTCLLKGMDDVDFVLSHLPKVEAYEVAVGK